MRISSTEPHQWSLAKHICIKSRKLMSTKCQNKLTPRGYGGINLQNYIRSILTRKMLINPLKTLWINRSRQYCVVCRGSREWVKSKFLCQDADVISLADKCIIVRCFVCGDYDKILTETGKFTDNTKVTENWLLSGDETVLHLPNYTFKDVGDRLDPLGKSVNFDLKLLSLSTVLHTLHMQV